MEFLVALFTVIPPGTRTEVETEIREQEALRAAELSGQGILERLWRAPLTDGTQRTLGIWRAADEERVREAVASLPLFKWMTIEVTPLAPHPNDPEGN